MTYANGRVVHDADSHVMETADWFAPYAEAENLGELKLFGSESSRIDKIVTDAQARKRDPEASAKAAEHPIAGTKGWGAFGAFDGDERTAALTQLGFASQLVFPTVGLRPVHSAKDSATRYAAARAYNRAIGAFCADKRLFAVAFAPLEDAAEAVKVAAQAIDAGCKAMLISSAAPGERSPGHPDFDPFWRLLSERNVPFMLHIGSGTMTQPKAFQNNGRLRSPDLHGGGENLRFCDYIMLWYAPQIFLTAMIYDGVFERFPRLRGGVIESGAGWVPDFLRQLDIAHRAFSRTDPYLKQLPLLPSEYIRRAVKFTPFPSEDVSLMISQAGADLFLFSSDYPHPEGTSDPLGRFERSLTQLDETVKDKFYRSNFEAMMGMSPSAPY